MISPASHKYKFLLRESVKYKILISLFRSKYTLYFLLIYPYQCKKQNCTDTDLLK